MIVTTTLTIRNGKLKFQIKERHYKKKILEIFVIDVRLKVMGHILFVHQDILLIFISHLKDLKGEWWKSTMLTIIKFK